MKVHNKGFTLVELSIVLVILGLLVGGVLTGQSLIRAAELRAVTTEFRNYQTALATFRDKYFALPGDMTNAVSFWGAQAGSTAAGYDSICGNLTIASTGTSTCNGDGDGLINTYPTNSTAYEAFRAWQQLANAGLVAGKFTGISNNGVDGSGATAGSNVPASKISGAGWTFRGLGASPLTGAYFAANYGNMLWFGGNVATTATYNPVLLAVDQYNIDMKIDDGKPHTGILLSGVYGWRPNCIVSTNDAYNLSSTTIGCTGLFITGF